MKIATIVLAGLLVPFSADRTANTEKAASEKKMEARSDAGPGAQPDSEALIIVPLESRYVMQPGHPIVVLFTGACMLGEPTGSIELLEPAPGFIEVIALCRCDGGVIGALVIKPSNKDVGLHRVGYRTVGCDGSPTESGFEIKVKKPAS
jgi:hypothetical protein